MIFVPATVSVPYELPANLIRTTLMPRHFARSLFCGSLFLAVVAVGATYDVGPGLVLTKLSDVSWGGLQPGDIVNIHAKPGGYREIIQVSAAGTVAQPILIRGIPDPVTGALPIIDGDGAVMDPRVDFRSTGGATSAFEEWGVIIVTPRKTGYVYGGTFPEYITIETLDIRNALYDPTGVRHFTDQLGAQRIYDPFACGIYIEFARHLTIRGCEISFNGNGIFANSKNGAAQSSVDLLIEKNYIHDNGEPVISNQTASNGRVYADNGFHEHNIYVEALGAVYQYNRFGPLRAGCFGCVIKDRSSGTVIRYNEVTSTDASTIFWILDPQGGGGYIDQQSDYRDAFVYGNVITFLPTSVTSGNLVAGFGAYNGISSYPTQHRGTLYFYNNTVVSHQSIAAFFLTDPVYSGSPNILEKVECRNNIFYTDSSIQDYYHAFHFMHGGGATTMNLGVNWVSPGSRYDWGGHPWTGGTINGSTTLVNLPGAVAAGPVNGAGRNLVGDATGLNNPGFVNLAGGDYHLTSAANSIDAGGLLDQAILTQGYLDTEQYLAPQGHLARVASGAAADLGAFEFIGATPNAAPSITTQPVSQSVAVGANVTFTVTASGTPAPTFQWQKGGVAIAGATSSTLTLTTVQIGAAATYTVVVTNSPGAATSIGAVLTVAASAGRPVITVQPLSHAVFVGGAATMTVVASGTPAPTYQWQRNGIDLPGATNASLSLSNIQVSNSGGYAVIATNPTGTDTSRFANLVVLVTQPNAITYGPTVFPTGVTAGGNVGLDYLLTNIGTRNWGVNHYLSVRDSNGSFVAFTSLIGVNPGEKKTAHLTFTAPMAAGTYTYTVQALENGVEFFSTQVTVTLVVLAPQLNSITYNTTNFAISATPGSNLIFNYNVTNTGTKAWGVNHALSLRDSVGTYLVYGSLNGVAPGQSKTVNMNFKAPTAPGIYLYFVQAAESGVGAFTAQANLTLTVLAPQPNAMVYTPTRSVDNVTPGATVDLRYALSNAGTAVWGSGHYASLRDAAGTYLAFIPLSGVVPAGSKTINFTLVAPTTPGIYTYYVQGLEDGIEFFGTQDIVIVTVLSTPIPNGATYNASTFPTAAARGANVTFTTNVTNRGTKIWGANHYLSLRDADNAFLGFPALNGIAPGGSTTATFTFAAPATPGIYTYHVQGLEAGIEFFAMSDTLVLTVP